MTDLSKFSISKMSPLTAIYRVLVGCSVLATCCSLLLVHSYMMMTAVTWTAILITALVLSWSEKSREIVEADANPNLFEQFDEWIVVKLCQTAWWVELGYVY